MPQRKRDENEVVENPIPGDQPAQSPYDLHRKRKSLMPLTVCDSRSMVPPKFADSRREQTCELNYDFIQGNPQLEMREK